MRRPGIAAFALVAHALAGCAPEPGPGKPADTATDTAAPACVPAAEVPYDGVDQDCDGADLTDVDGDGHDATVAGGADCDDADDAIHPDADEACDGVDNDCDGTDDDKATWHADWDGDGYGSTTSGTVTCSPSEGYVLDGTDCDNADPDVFPGAPERCNGVDDDCDGIVPDDEADADGDGWRACELDCDDADPHRAPDTFERCDGVDDDCDGVVDDACTTCDRAVPEDHATIQEALDAAVDGDVICVGPGTWNEYFLDFGGADVTLLGVLGAERTIIDPDTFWVPVFRFVSGEGPDAVLRGFTITGGGGETGGAIDIVDASPTLVDLVLTGNYTTNHLGRGGAIHVTGGAPTLTRLVVRENWSSGGGYDGYGYGYGGGIYLNQTDAVLDDILLADNGAGDAGGGLAVVDATAVVLNAHVTGNWVDHYGGGGIWIDGGAPTFANVAVTDNAVGSTWGHEPDGGGIYVTGEATPTFTNVLVSGNSSRDGVGGIHVASGTPVFVNAVVTANTGATTGGVSGVATLRYTNAWGNTPTNFGDTDPTGTDGNLSVDPDLYDDAGHLGATSPMVDAGDPAILDPDGSPSDIGAFGGPGAATWDLDGDGWPSWWLPGPYDATTSPGLDCDDTDAAVFPGTGC